MQFRLYTAVSSMVLFCGSMLPNDIGLIPMWYRCDIAVIPMLYRCDADVIPMWYCCDIDVISMCYRCDIDVISVCYRCDTDVIPKRYWCDMDVILCVGDVIPTWFRRNTDLISMTSWCGAVVMARCYRRDIGVALLAVRLLTWCRCNFVHIALWARWSCLVVRCCQTLTPPTTSL